MVCRCRVTGCKVYKKVNSTVYSRQSHRPNQPNRALHEKPVVFLCKNGKETDGQKEKEKNMNKDSNSQVPILILTSPALSITPD